MRTKYNRPPSQVECGQRMDFTSNYYRKSFEKYPKIFSKAGRNTSVEEKEAVEVEEEEEDNVPEELELHRSKSYPTPDDNNNNNHVNYPGYIENEEDQDFGNGNREEDDILEFFDGDVSPEVPATPSSFDCSSIGSIPWAEDAIKENREQWESIERMLNGLEPLPNDEELSREISDWQQKFPQLFPKYSVAVYRPPSPPLTMSAHRILSSRGQPPRSHREGINTRLVRQPLRDTDAKHITEMSDQQLTEFLRSLGILTVPRYPEQHYQHQQQPLRPVVRSYRLQDGPPAPIYKAFSPPRTASPLSRVSKSRRCPRMPPIIPEMPNVNSTAPPHTQRKHRSFVLLGQVPQSSTDRHRDQLPSAMRLAFIHQHRNGNSPALPVISHQQQGQEERNLTANSIRQKEVEFRMRSLRLREPMNSSTSSAISSDSAHSHSQQRSQQYDRNGAGLTYRSPTTTITTTTLFKLNTAK